MLGYSFLVYLAIAIALISSFIIKRTRVGLHLRAVGENPATADSAGINVNRYKYLATCIGCMIAGLGGLYYVMDYASGIWANNAFGDRGWLAIALVIFTLWKPNVSIVGSYIFGALYIAAFVFGNITSSEREILKMLPYVITIIVLKKYPKIASLTVKNITEKLELLVSLGYTRIESFNLGKF